MEPLTSAALAQEVANGNFADDRLNRRLHGMVSTLATHSTESLPRAFDSAGLEGAYRFLSNYRVTPEKVLGPHIEATKVRCSEEPTFLVAHDTTTLSYRYNGERKGLGRLQRNRQGSSQAFFAHVSLALTADGTQRPLGVGALHTWTRLGPSKGDECLRWEAQALEASRNLDGLKNAVHLMDREADDYQMLSAFLEGGHRFVVRSSSDRRLTTTMGTAKLRETLATAPAMVEREVPLQRRKAHPNPILKKIHPPRQVRMAKLSVSATAVELKRPSTKSQAHLPLPPTLRINVVRVWEAEPPEGDDPVEWYLYTSEPIDTPEQVLTVVDYYRARWTIEEYNKGLKTGCNFEARQMGDYEGLVNMLAVFAPIAYWMLLIRSETRRDPDQSATAVLTPDQITVLRAIGRTKLSAQPTVREAYLAIAVLGGHYKYSKRDPGWLTLARGLQDLVKLTDGYRIARLQSPSDQR